MQYPYERGATLFEVLIAVVILSLISIAIVSSLYVSRVVPGKSQTVAALLTELDNAAQEVAMQPFLPCSTTILTSGYTTAAPVAIKSIETVLYNSTTGTTRTVDCDMRAVLTLAPGETDDRASQPMQVVTLGIPNPYGAELTKAIMKVRP